MAFKEILKRYHISPLQYEDGKELTERDYLELFKFLMKYYCIRGIFDKNFVIPSVPMDSMDKVKRCAEKSLLPLTEEECLDILMKTKPIIL